MAEPEPTAIPILPPEEAIAIFRAKGLAKSFDWRDVWKAEHGRAFTVAKMMSTALLEDIREIIDAGLAEGKSFGQIAGELKQLLRSKGWWGRQMMTDPLTGERKAVQLGSERRIRTIVNTNMRTAYAQGRFQRIQRVKKALPIMVYKSVMDGRERDEHRVWHNTALPVDDPWWDTHYPPCDWGCRCKVVSMTGGQAARRGLSVGDAPKPNRMRQVINKRTGEIMQVERGIGAGWDYHVGKSPFEGLAPVPMRGFGLDESASEASALAGATGRWLKAFDVPAEGGEFRDVTGWPLPVSKRWLSGLSAARQNAATIAAAAIASPDMIRMLWVTGKDGRKMLVRRYLKGSMTVDVGSSFWRFTSLELRGIDALKSGVEIWRSESLSAASYNPNQPRHGKGGSNGGEFRSTATGAVGRMLKSSGHQEHDFGAISNSEAALIQSETGLNVKGYSRVMRTSEVRHAFASHGNSAKESARGQVGIRPSDFEMLPQIAFEGKSRSIGDVNSRKPLRIEHIADLGGRRFVYLEIVAPREKKLLFKTLRIETGKG